MLLPREDYTVSKGCYREHIISVDLVLGHKKKSLSTVEDKKNEGGKKGMRRNNTRGCTRDNPFGKKLKILIQ